MRNGPQKHATVKPLEGARVTPALGAAAIGDGGRSLEQLDCSQAEPLERWPGGAMALGAICVSSATPPGERHWPAELAGWLRRPQPEAFWGGLLALARCWPERCPALPCEGCGCPAERCWHYLRPGVVKCCPDCTCERWRCWQSPQADAAAALVVGLTLRANLVAHKLRRAERRERWWWGRKAAEPEPVAVAPGGSAALPRLPASPQQGGGGASAAGRHGGLTLVGSLMQQLRELARAWESAAEVLPALTAEARFEIRMCAAQLAESLDDFEAQAVLDGLEQLGREGLLRGRGLVRVAWPTELQRASECKPCGLYWAPWFFGPVVGAACTACGRPTTELPIKGTDVG